MTQVKTFDITSPAASEEEAPVPFKLVWTNADGTKGDEEFKAYPSRIPPAMVMKLPNMRIDGHSAAFFRTFEIALGEDYERFEAVLMDPNRHVHAEVLAELVGWLAELSSKSEVDRGSPTGPSAR